MSEQNQKKILFLITKSNWGGGQRYVHDIAVHLNPNEFDVAVALGGDGELAQRLKRAGIRVIHIPGLQRDVSLQQELKATGAIARIIRMEKPDILHVNSSKAGAIGAVLGRIYGIKRVVFTALGWAFNEDRPTWQKVLIKAIHWITVLAAHKTIALSYGMKAQMNWPWTQKKIIVIHLGRRVTDMADRSSAREILIEKIREQEKNASPYKNDLWIGSLSELHLTKQLHRIVDSLAVLTKDFPTMRYIMIGSGQERERLESQIKNLGLEEHVFLTGAIPDAGNLLKALDLFVFPSRSEAFGYVLLEAGAAHLPVVSTKTGGILDVVIDGETGLLVPPCDTPSLTSAIRKMLSDETLREKLAKAHYERSQTFTVEKMIERTVVLYQ